MEEKTKKTKIKNKAKRRNTTKLEKWVCGVRANTESLGRTKWRDQKKKWGPVCNETDFFFEGEVLQEYSLSFVS